MDPAPDAEDHLLFLSARAGAIDPLGRQLRDIYRTSTAGDPAVNLTREPSRYFHVSVSADGRRVAFASDRDGCDIWTMESNGDDLRRLTGPGEGCNAWPRWSPSGTQLAFASNRDSRQIGQTGGLYDVYVADIGTNAVRNVTAAFSDELGYEVEVIGWSPAGEIVFETYGGEHEGRRTYLVSTDGARMERFLEPGDHSVSWSPDGARVAFIREHDGLRRIFVSSHDGTDLRPLFAMTVSDRLPNGCCGMSDVRFDIQPWSPDSRRIAFERMSGQAVGTVHVINVDGTGLRQLTPFAASFNGWSRSGGRIAVTRRTPSGPAGVYVFVSNYSASSLLSAEAGDGDAIWVH
ncbi:MAG TPA: hypothetical protein VK933_04960 [Longimicrobiales bacterium]|nr:hypothetical protein [Longimicrobiales bacterium]